MEVWLQYFINYRGFHFTNVQTRYTFKIYSCLLTASIRILKLNLRTQKIIWKSFSYLKKMLRVELFKPLWKLTSHYRKRNKNFNLVRSSCYKFNLQLCFILNTCLTLDKTTWEAFSEKLLNLKLNCCKSCN